MLKRRYELSINVVRKDDGWYPCLLQLLKKVHSKGIARYYQPDIVIVYCRVDLVNITDGVRPVSLFFENR